MKIYVAKGAPFTQGTIPSIPIGSSISPEGFLLLVLLLVVIIVTVVIVIVILIVVVDDVSHPPTFVTVIASSQNQALLADPLPLAMLMASFP
ncbi:hypothetical protein Tco_0859699 [Tanacetum coccineum]|uniref:Uncharacterized protein n=1 Tax=Tanacetum coccineum TaxID=301880 RepID=A0ABQ5BG11_9ASTR